MQDREKSRSIQEIADRWSNYASWAFVSIVLIFTVAVMLFERVQNFFVAYEWIHSISVVMTLSVGYIFTVAHVRERITQKDSHRSYKEGQEEGTRKITGIRQKVERDTRTSIPKQEVLDLFNSEDDDS